MRDVYVRPPRKFQLAHNQLPSLLKRLYGLTYAGDYWHNTVSRHLRSDLNMAPITGYLSLFSRAIRGRLSGLVGSYVDDTLRAGDEEFERLSCMMEHMFKSSPRSYEDISFACI